MKLKTLKDIERDIYFPPLKPKSVAMLKTIAREWIVSNNEIINGFDVYLYDEMVKMKEYQAINKWIEYFFNLGEKI